MIFLIILFGSRPLKCFYFWKHFRHISWTFILAIVRIWSYLWILGLTAWEFSIQITEKISNFSSWKEIKSVKSPLGENIGRYAATKSKYWNVNFTFKSIDFQHISKLFPPPSSFKKKKKLFISNAGFYRWNLQSFWSDLGCPIHTRCCFAIPLQFFKKHLRIRPQCSVSKISNIPYNWLTFEKLLRIACIFTIYKPIK